MDFLHTRKIFCLDCGMLLDCDKEIRMLGVEGVVSIRQELSLSASLNLSAMTKSRNEEHSSESVCDKSSSVNEFDLPIINQTAASFDKMMDLNS